MDGGEKLKIWLEEHKHSQQWLAETLGASRSMVSSWLTGKHKPNELHAFAIERITGGEVTAASLLIPGVDDPLAECLRRKSA